MPLGPRRAGRGVIDAPVAKVAVVGAAMGPGPSPVAKAAVVGAAVSPGPSPGDPDRVHAAVMAELNRVRA